MREIKPYPIVDKLINMFDNWLKHRQEISEMREFDAGEFARIAHELGVTPDDLDTLVRRGPHAIEELPKLLTALGIAISPPAPPGSTTRNIAATQRPSTRWCRRLTKPLRQVHMH